MQNFDKAILDFSNAINIDPALDFAYMSRSISYSQKGDYQKALDDALVLKSKGYKEIEKHIKKLRETMVQNKK